MRLYLVQHGEAKPKEEDPERHLTERGAEEVRRVAEFLVGADLAVGEVWHSGKTRAAETAEILTCVLRVSPTVLARDDLAPTAPVAPVAEEVNRRSDDLLVVGHLPFLSRLAGHLISGGGRPIEPIRFQYGGVLCLGRDPEGSWGVEWMVVPRLIVR